MTPTFKSSEENGYFITLDEKQKELWSKPVEALLPAYDHLSKERLHGIGIRTVAELVWTHNRDTLLEKGLYPGPVAHILNCVTENGFAVNARQVTLDALKEPASPENASIPRHSVYEGPCLPRCQKPEQNKVASILLLYKTNVTKRLSGYKRLIPKSLIVK